MNAIPMIEPKSWRRSAACLVLGLGLLATSAAASAQARLSLADLAAQIEALRGQVTTLTQANSNLQGQRPPRRPASAGWTSRSSMAWGPTPSTVAAT